MITCWAFAQVSKSICRSGPDGLKFDSWAETISHSWPAAELPVHRNDQWWVALHEPEATRFTPRNA
jgi:hypothetical protein